MTNYKWLGLNRFISACSFPVVMLHNASLWLSTQVSFAMLHKSRNGWFSVWHVAVSWRKPWISVRITKWKVESGQGKSYKIRDDIVLLVPDISIYGFNNQLERINQSIRATMGHPRIKIALFILLLAYFHVRHFFCLHRDATKSIYDLKNYCLWPDTFSLLRSQTVCFSWRWRQQLCTRAKSNICTP